jgi:hypothetical protein
MQHHDQMSADCSCVIKLKNEQFNSIQLVAWNKWIALGAVLHDWLIKLKQNLHKIFRVLDLKRIDLEHFKNVYEFVWLELKDIS